MDSVVRKNWLRKARILLWPFPVGWVIWFTIYCTSVDANDGRGFPGEMFWWDEALFVAFFLGTISAAPIFGFICVVLSINYTRKQFAK